MTDCMKFDAKDINRCIRGRIFLFTDALLSKEYPENFEMDIYKATEYLQKYMGFLTIYLNRFDKLSYAVFIYFYHYFTYSTSILKV